MPSIGNVLNIAQLALSAQQAGLNVSGQNIANVNTPGYSRQTIDYQAGHPLLYGGFLFGTGVNIEQVQRVASQMLENSLVSQQSQLSAATESQSNMSVMQSFFNANSTNSLGTLVSDFWNAWQDLSNNPTGSAERDSVYQKGQSLSQTFADLNTNMAQMSSDLTQQIAAGITNINTITKQIAKVNGEIVALQAGGTANDQLDKRQALVSELGQMVDVRTFQQPNGTLTVTTANGYTLVSGVDTYDLSLTQGKVTWRASNGGQVDITSKITGGKIGGWLDTRDSVLPKYLSDLDVMAKQVIWAVNKVHSQGAALDYFNTPMTGTYVTDATRSFSTLAFGNQIDYTQNFKMWVQNNGSVNPTDDPMSIDLNLSTAKVDPTSWAGTAGAGGSPPYTYRFTVLKAGTVDNVVDAVNDPVLGWQRFDSNGVGIAQGFVSVNAGSLRVDDASNPGVAGITFNIGAGTLVAGNTFEVSTNLAGEPQNSTVTVKGTANSVLDTYQFKVTKPGTVGTDPVQIGWTNGVTSGSLTLDPSVKPPTFNVDGMSVSFLPTTYFSAGNEFAVTTDSNGAPSTQLPGDWHWTLDSFRDQFNRQANGITASVTTDNRLQIQTQTAAHRISNIAVSSAPGSATAATVDVNDYQALTKAGSGFTLKYDGSKWGVDNNAGYSGAKVVAEDASHASVDLNGDGLADISVGLNTGTPPNSGDTVQFDITSETGPFGFGFSDNGSTDSGLAAALGLNTFFTGTNAMTIGVNSTLTDSRMVAAGNIDATTGQVAVGDNSNALALANLQYDTQNLAQWTFQRGSDPSSAALSATIEGYHQAMVASLGIKADSVNRAVDFSKTMVKTIGVTRDSLSGVSLDEEMISMMKFQQAYSAAAKLITTSDQMLQALLSVRP